MIKDAEPNKCVLEAVKSRDPGLASLGACQGSLDLLFKFWDPALRNFLTEETTN